MTADTSFKKGTLGASDTSTRARAVRIMKNFVRGSHDKSSIERLKIRIQDFRTLIDDALKLASTHGGLPASLQSLDLVRDCANRLYNALQAGWRCNCNEVHPANMQLEIWPMSSAGSKVVSDSSEFKFCFLFAPDVEVAQSEYWMVAEIAISQQSMISSGGVSPCEQEFVELTNALQALSLLLSRQRLTPFHVLQLQTPRTPPVLMTWSTTCVPT